MCVLLFRICICLFYIVILYLYLSFLWLPAVCSSLTAADPGFVFLYVLDSCCFEFVFVFLYCYFVFVFETSSGCQLFAPQSRPLTLVLSILLICAPWDNFLLGGAATFFLSGDGVGITSHG